MRKDNVRVKFILHEYFQPVDILKQSQCHPLGIYKILTIYAKQITPKTFYLAVNIYITVRTHDACQNRVTPTEQFLQMCSRSLPDV